MRFGTFHLPLSPTPADDRRVVEEQMQQIEAAEALGFDYAWLTEHNFTGESGYADPIVFGAALSQRTSRIRVGFAVVQMALHHPTRLLIQTSLLDNLLDGRLTIGIGRGSAFNEYEYVAFGARSEGQRERMFEAIELMERAWAGDNTPYEGEHFQLRIPGVRPTPVQKPHPPLMLSVLSDDTVAWAAARGYPIMMPRLDLARATERLAFYRRAMEEASIAPERIGRALDSCTLQRSVYVAATDEQAHEEVQEATFRLHRHLQHSRQTFNPTDVDNRARAAQNASQKWSSPDSTPEEAVADLISRGFILGSPETVRGKLREIRDAGVRGMMLSFTWGDLRHEMVLRSMERFGREVMPEFTAETAGVGSA